MDITQIANLVVQLVDAYGVAGMVMLILFVLVIKFGNKIVELIADKAVKGGFKGPSDQKRKLRKDSIFKVNSLLTELMQKTQADHVALFEYHNGGYNLTGLPFLHFTLSIQRNNYGVEELHKDFNNVLVSSVPEFIRQVDSSDLYFVDDIAELETTFPRLYKELKNDGTKEVVFCCLEGICDEVGFLMVSFRDPLGSRRKKVQKELFKKVQKISTLLDLKKLD